MSSNSERKSTCKNAFIFFIKYPGPFVLLALYTYGGAKGFMYFETEHEETKIQDVHQKRLELLESLWTLAINTSTELDSATALVGATPQGTTQGTLSVTANNGILKNDWVNETVKKIIRFENFARGKLNSCTLVEDGQQKITWRLWEALFFCGTIYTTIGYGFTAPETDYGRLFSIFYAAFGIPLCWLALAKLGEALLAGLRAWIRSKTARVIFCLISHLGTLLKEIICRCNKNKIGAPSHATLRTSLSASKNVDYQPSVVGGVIIVLVYILSGAAMYRLWEDWHYLDSCYFIFESLTTIGSGDVQPSHPKYFILTCIYLFIGLALVTMVINIIVGKVLSNLEKEYEKHKSELDQDIPMTDVDDIQFHLEEQHQLPKIILPDN